MLSRIVADDGGVLSIDRARLRDALTRDASFNDVISPISCDSFEDCGAGRVRIMRYNDPTVDDNAELPPAAL